MSLLALLAAHAAAHQPPDPDPPTDDGWGIGTAADPVYVPPGSMTAWRAARENADAELVDALIFGDSTIAYGQATDVGAKKAAASMYLRNLATTDGYPDGGDGITGIGGVNPDTNVPWPMTYAPVPARSGTFVDGPSQALFRHVTMTSDAAGEWHDVQGYGTRVRLHYYAQGDWRAKWSYSVDGGAPVQVAPDGAAPIFRAIDITGLSNGLHTVRITNDGPGDGSSDSRVMVVADFTRATGITWHRAGVTGARSGDALLAQTDYLIATHRPRLMVAAWGINDANTAAPNDPSAGVQANVEAFIDKARAAGASPVVVIPHLVPEATGDYQDEVKAALKAAADAKGAARIDLGEGGALGPRAGWVAAGYVEGTVANVHLTALGCQTQATYLWDQLLKL